MKKRRLPTTAILSLLLALGGALSAPPQEAGASSLEPFSRAGIPASTRPSGSDGTDHHLVSRVVELGSVAAGQDHRALGIRLSMDAKTVPAPIAPPGARWKGRFASHSRPSASVSGQEEWAVDVTAT